jgi:ribulose-phosphate 3-epimerase
MAAAGAAWLHLDVMDGQFVPPITFGDALAKGVGSMSSLPMEAHLMILSPERQIEAFAEAGCKRIIFHAEVAPHGHRVVQHIHSLGLEAGIAINPGTSDSVIAPLVDLVESVLVMTVNPGYGGQKFLPEVLPKVARLRAARPDLTIEVDGGIDPKTIPLAMAAGANLFVVGSYLLRPSSIAEAVRDLEEACG